MILKIGLFTLDARNNNYGGLLQEYALFKTLQKLGYDVEVVDYNLSSELNTFSYKRSLKYLTPDKILKKVQKKVLKKKVVESTIPNKSSRELFAQFRDAYITFSEKCSYRDLKQLNEEYDGFVCGSDQVWNPAYNIPSFFLEFVKDKKKVIYGASLGVSKLSSVEKSTYKALLSDLTSISVREKQGQAIISTLTSQEVKVVLDPTMILGKDEWLKFVKKNKSSQPYIFCYFLGMNSAKIDAAKKFARKNNYKIISIPFEHSDFGEEEFPTYNGGLGPIEFLNLIYNAECILTDSFHASVFSILFNKEFRVFSRNIGKLNMNERLYTLLELIDRMDLFIQPNELDLVSVDENIKYDFSKIEIMRMDSVRWLDNALKAERNEKC